jgi:curli biogenesis system outer membrane secretion channel CsgG
MFSTKYWTYFLILMSVLLVSCEMNDQFMNPTKVTSSTPVTIRQAQSENPNGPKLRVCVMDFTDKSAQGGGQIGTGMKEQLVTALSQTNAFIVLERDALNAVMAEQDMGQTGRFKEGTVAKTGELVGASFLIYGAVTEYSDSESSVSGGVQGLGSIGNVIAPAVGAALNQAHVAIDMRLVDTQTGQVVNSTSVEGSPRDLSAGLSGGYSRVLLGLSGSYRTPREKAVRACMIKAVNWIASNAR